MSATALRRRRNGVVAAPSPSSLQVSEEHITPAQALAYLEANPNNRHMRRPAVDALARAMVNHDFNGLNGETIKLTSDGELVDGQHRLAAVVQAGVPQMFLVVRGVPFDVADTVDSGVARTFSDVLKRRGWTNVTNVAAASRYLWFYDNELPMAGGGFKPTHQELLEVAEVNNVAAAVHYEPFDRFVGVTNGAFLRVVCGRASEEDTLVFADRVGSGVGLAAGDPILALRSRIINMRATKPGHARPHPYYPLAWSIKAFNAWRRGDTLQKVAWNPGGAHPEKFPRIEVHA